MIKCHICGGEVTRVDDKTVVCVGNCSSRFRSLAEPGVEEIEAWAKLNPEAPLSNEQLLKAWHWMRAYGPYSCWTNAGAVIVRMLLLEIFRVKLRSQQRKSRLVKIANRKRKELKNGEGA